MAKENTGQHHQTEARRKKLTLILGVSGLCILFYVLGAWQNSNLPASYSKMGCETQSNPSSSTSSSSSESFDLKSHNQDEFKETNQTIKYFEPCDLSLSEYTPCEDRQRGRKFDRNMMKYRERHCPTKDELLYCLIPPPPNYKIPFKWPQSRDYAWYGNIPHKELSVEKAVQNWIQVEGDRFRFPGGGTMFPRGADAYIDDIARLIPLTNGGIRTAIDTGCGVASFGAYLLKRDIMAVSFAPRDTHEAQVQFALERGVPAIIGIMGSRRLPYPARAFDLAHCSRCLIPWFKNDGLYLMEVDRVLRPGGYWILSGPPINWKQYWRGWERTEEDLKQEQDSIENVAKSLCWKKVTEKGDLSIWQKPINHIECKKLKQNNKSPPICSSDNADSAWYKDLEPCVTPLPNTNNPEESAGGALEDWPDRAFAVPPRILRGTIQDINTEMFREDNEVWKERIAHYKKIVPELSRGRFRNIMDMNAYLGGFAASMLKYPSWVMNVVPVDAEKQTLGVIFERGLIGTYQDWCEGFSTYPRTYDMIHAGGLFSLYKNKCDLTLILLEMDRILRPEGTVVLRDNVEMLTKVERIAKGMKWNTQIVDHEKGPYNPEKILVAVKTYWTGQPSNNNKNN
ncbi:putative methyltransferase PMT17 [Raphanus sativus]|uniref:Methyltransferase n=1 Tax=Raphanus sativus TaxID=3726 RepID=A0A6J0LAI6_RAPSA|nr:probable methyltransferase PMT17 [Raphanus sativus]XP_018456853.1 probable methyltransferase PMT17 [Raphanus sativus]XP_056849439.1 probable methyltransferase PMT17 [Raphanus sativus]KAJ4876181.1 putative methyltransferase PMT17 [Raphanus sativus]